MKNQIVVLLIVFFILFTLDNTTGFNSIYHFSAISISICLVVNVVYYAIHLMIIKIINR